jgi:hypothetical protein
LPQAPARLGRVEASAVVDHEPDIRADDLANPPVGRDVLAEIGVADL